MSNQPEPLDLDAIEARARAVVDEEAKDSRADLSAAIDCFDATAVDDMLLVIAEVRRLAEKLDALQRLIGDGWTRDMSDRDHLRAEFAREFKSEIAAIFGEPNA